MAAKDQDAKTDEPRQLFSELRSAYTRASEAVPSPTASTDEGARSRFAELIRRIRAPRALMPEAS